MKALILAGGFGTRLKEVVRDVPKPMVQIGGRPFLEHQLKFLREQGVDEAILAVHYMSNKIKAHFGSGILRFGINITYSDEETPLGTAGAIKNAQKYIDETFFVLNGDSYTNLDLRKFLEFHKESGAEGTLALTNQEDVSHYGAVTLNGKRIKEFSEKKSPSSGLINAGIYAFEPSIFDYIESGRVVSLEKEIFPELARMEKLCGYIHEGYFIDIGRPETYSQFKKEMLEKMVISEDTSVREAMKKIERNETDLILVADNRRKLLGVLNNKIIRRHLLSGGNLEDKVSYASVKDPLTAEVDDDEGISELFHKGINHLPILNKNGEIVDVRFRVEEVKPETFQIIRGRAPLRISFAGGGTDVPYFFEKYGGIVINSTIDKYCHGTLVRRADSKIVLNSDLEREIILDGSNLKYDGKLDIVKSVVKIMEPSFGFELYLHNDIPPGRGLGSSASVAVLTAKLLGQAQGIEHTNEEVAKIAHKAEREELGIGGGWQDQYATAIGGFNFIEFNKDKTIIYPLRLKDEIMDELNSRLLLCYVGGSHFSGSIHKRQEESFAGGEEDYVRKVGVNKRIATDFKDSLLTGKLTNLGPLLHESWQVKKEWIEDVSNPRIDTLYDAGLRNGANGGKLLGAGGAGYLLFSYSPTKRNALVRALESEGGEILDFNFEFKGAHTWTVKQ